MDKHRSFGIRVGHVPVRFLPEEEDEGMNRRRQLQALNLWIGFLLFGAAIVFFGFYVLPRWVPDLRAFFSGFDPLDHWPILALSFVSALLSQHVGPRAWQMILRGLHVQCGDPGAVRRNWYLSQMGSYIPGKFWMFIGRIAFLRTCGAGPALGLGAIALENIYLMVSVCALALVSLPFLSGAEIHPSIQFALGASVAAALVMVLVPGIQKLLARWMSQGLEPESAPLPRISQKSQVQAVGFDVISWSFRSGSMFLWFLGAGVGNSDPVMLLAACLVATPVSWLVALVLVFFPAGLGVRESVQGLLLSGFAGGSLAVATTVALSHRLILISAEGLYAVHAAGFTTLQRRNPRLVMQARNARRLAGSLLQAFFARLGLTSPPDPINVTFSVTRRCQSRCRTCYIWEAGRLPELTLDEIGALFRSIGWTYFFNVSGGEPFLREDLPEIVRLACRHLRPAVVHIPTNALLPERIEQQTSAMLEIIAEEAPGTLLTIKPSFDGIGTTHDEIRGVPGNFEKLLDTLARLRALRAVHPDLHVGVGTVVSRFNAGQLDSIIEYARSLGVDTYISEIAEEREEFFNRGSGITPDASTYRLVMDGFKAAAREKMKGMRLLGRVTTALRLVYYDVVVRIMAEDRQVIPCYAGLLNVHINADGAVWPCAILAYRSEMGRLGADGDFRRIWRSARARSIRGSIRRKECNCPLANQAYSNILMDPGSLLKALRLATKGS
jgi:MoaA/NifB/PqqE/SkfB family radical SAM enzyme